MPPIEKVFDTTNTYILIQLYTSIEHFIKTPTHSTKSILNFIFAKNLNINLEDSILLELQYLPSIQYVTKLLQYPTVWIEQHENYSKGSYRNRCHLASAQGLLRLSIPLAGGKHQQQPIREVKIAYKEPWQSQHWTAIKSAYGKSPFFEYYADFFQPLFQKKYTYLWDWNWDLLQQILQVVAIDTNIQLTEQFDKKPKDGILDFRNSISPKPSRHVLDKSYKIAQYVQVFEEKHGFLPDLSILDLLFCSGPEAVVYLQCSIVEG